MRLNQAKQFFDLLAGVAAVYGKAMPELVQEVYWKALLPYDYTAVADAFNRHVVNPDTGQFMPKPADVIRMMGGTTQDAALVAWAKVDRTVRSVGTWRDVVFDDALIHRVIQDMGGWVSFGNKSEDEWPFVAKEFENRYRGFALRRETPDYPKVLTGIAGMQNQRNGFVTEQPVLIGSPELAIKVQAGGGVGHSLQVTEAVAAAHALHLVGAK